MVLRFTLWLASSSCSCRAWTCTTVCVATFSLRLCSLLIAGQPSLDLLSKVSLTQDFQDLIQVNLALNLPCSNSSLG